MAEVVLGGKGRWAMVLTRWPRSPASRQPPTHHPHHRETRMCHLLCEAVRAQVTLWLSYCYALLACPASSRVASRRH